MDNTIGKYKNRPKKTAYSLIYGTDKHIETAVIYVKTHYLHYDHGTGFDYNLFS